MIINILNGNLLDTESMELVGERHVTLVEGRIADVSESLPTGHAVLVIDAGGHNVMPGFIDGHVHHVITTMDFARLVKMSPAGSTTKPDPVGEISNFPPLPASSGKNCRNISCRAARAISG